MAILITGGAGYIGSHTAFEFLTLGYEIVVVDNLSNGNKEALDRISKITDAHLHFYNIDILDRNSLDSIFRAHSIEAVIHFAGYKSINESFAIPLEYYRNNVVGTINLCQTMQKFGVKKLVVSSTAAIYSPEAENPVSEGACLEAASPYGQSKLMMERLLIDLHRSDASWSIALLRYFNPIGAHSSGYIGENPSGNPNNLVPYIMQVAIGRLQELKVYGNDYPTPDGTGIRDFIHVVDLAVGHVKALQKVLSSTGIEAYNLGTGKGYSVLDMIHTSERVTGRRIPYRIEERRPGDLAVRFANPSKANRDLGWTAKRGIDEMCEDAWRWQLNYPNGFQ